MNTIKQILIENDFEEHNDVFTLQTENGKFVLESENIVNERYKSRKYYFETYHPKSVKTGTFYTNNAENFRLALSRRLTEFLLTSNQPYKSLKQKTTITT